MKIELAQHTGFCSGVRKAIIRIVKEIDETDGEILIYGPLIHNPQTVEILDSRGLKTIDSLDNIENQTVAIRTHGIIKSDLLNIKSRSKRMINLTCPKVARVQSIIKSYSNKGYFPIVIGDGDHAEVKSIVSNAIKNYHIVSNLDDIKDIPNADKYIIVAQTTLSKTFFKDAIEKIESNYNNCKVINTICDSTNFRQNDLQDAIDRGVDAIVVTGGKNSANTKRLVQIGNEQSINTFHIETEEELNAEDFNNVNHVLVTAGASTPSWIINNVLEKLHTIKYKNKNRIISFFKSFIEIMFRANILSAALTAFMTLLIQSTQTNPKKEIIAIVSSIFIFSMFTINNLLQKKILRLNNPYKYNLYKNRSAFFITLGIISYITSLWLILELKVVSIIIFALMLIAGTVYSLKPVRKFALAFPFRLFRKIYSMRSLVASLGWIVIAGLFPFIENPFPLKMFIPLFIIISSLIIMRNLLIDLIAYQGDLILGVETLPTVFGIKFSRILLFSITIAAISSALFFALQFNNWFFLIYTICFFYYLLLGEKIVKLQYFYTFKYELLVDFNLILFSIITIFTI